MVMMLQFCECCEKEQWFELKTTALVGNSVIVKYVWNCRVCNWQTDYTTPTTALEQYLDELLSARGEIFQ